MTTTADEKHILIGTAGHIDHGKTRLVGRLTGIDTDRLPEEKTRGISIDLGFAHWELDGFQFGIVDVPGHERFVKNMVAGATGVNLALLVVAADDSIMPQTREHLEIMDLLGVKTGMVAITKTDVVDSEFVELVKAEIEEVIAGTFLEGCPVVPVSSETGAGIEELKSTLTQVARGIQIPETDQLFRMPIDRAISLPGHGTIVTGSVLSGDVHPGDTLELLPEGREVRVRSVQNHGVDAHDAGARQRTAINLAGVKHEDVSRGQELATAGYLRPTRRMLVQLRSLASSSVLLKDRIELNLHLGTREVSARIILKGRQLKAGERSYAELRLKEPAVATHAQRFILRRISPQLTVAGGTVLDPFIAPKKRVKDFEEYGRALDTDSDIDRLSTILGQHDGIEESPLEAAWRAGIPTARYTELMEHLKSDGILLHLGSSDRPILIHRDRLAALSASVQKTIREELARQQPRRSLPRNTLNTACRDITQPALLDALFEHLLATKQLVSVGPNLGPADAQVNLTKNQQQTQTRLLKQIANDGLTPTTSKELATALDQKLDQVEILLSLSVEEGLLVKVAEGLHFSPESLEQARGLCENLLAEIGEATMAQLRDAWSVSRKFSVPLCEHFDELGITVRKGDVRVAGPNISKPLH